MQTAATLLGQRSTGAVTIHMGQHGPSVLREEGSAKVRLPRGSRKAILINTSGGLAGGDAVDIEATSQSQLTLTSQAAERVYRSLGPPARVSVRLRVEPGASLHWLPQETILFDSAGLNRQFDVDLAEDCEFVAVEAVILGRKEMGETVRHMSLTDSWRISRNGRLLHADNFAIEGPPPISKATLGGATAFATIIAVSPRVDSIHLACPASTWNGKLVARLVAEDGFALRRLLVPALSAIVGPLPRPWML
jgi:urease accessory protein